MIEKFGDSQHHPENASVPVRHMQPAVYWSKPRGKKGKGKGKKKGRKRHEDVPSNRQLLALAIQELGAVAQVMAIQLSGKDSQVEGLPSASIEVHDYSVDQNWEEL